MSTINNLQELINVINESKVKQTNYYDDFEVKEKTITTWGKK